MAGLNTPPPKREEAGGSEGCTGTMVASSKEASRKSLETSLGQPRTRLSEKTKRVGLGSNEQIDRLEERLNTVVDGSERWDRIVVQIGENEENIDDIDKEEAEMRARESTKRLTGTYVVDPTPLLQENSYDRK